MTRARTGDEWDEQSRKINKTKQLVIANFLYAPTSFLLAPIHELRKIISGCGNNQSKLDFIPDKVLGVYLGDACIIHDWMYEEGYTIEDKEEADRVFLNNLLRIIAKSKKRIYRPKVLLRFLVKRYYNAVCIFGGPAFWANKPGV